MERWKKKRNRQAMSERGGGGGKGREREERGERGLQYGRIATRKLIISNKSENCREGKKRDQPPLSTGLKRWISAQQMRSSGREKWFQDDC